MKPLIEKYKYNLKNISLDDLLYKLFIISFVIIGIDSLLKLLSIFAVLNDTELNLRFIRRFDLYLTVVASVITFAIISFYSSINGLFKSIYFKYFLSINFYLKLIFLFAIVFYLLLLKFHFTNIYINGVSILIITSFFTNNAIHRRSFNNCRFAN